MKGKLAFLTGVGFILFLLLNASCAPARWSPADSYRQVAYTALAVVDWRQSRTIATQKTEHSFSARPDGSSTEVFGGRSKWHEVNPVLGEHPSTGKVDLYFAGAIVGDAVVAYLLPAKWRSWWQWASIAVEAGFVAHNFKIGVRF